MIDKMTDGTIHPGDFPKVTSTGKTETVAGYTCQHWLVGDKQDTDICMAKGLGYLVVVAENPGASSTSCKNSPSATR